jgi:hypothetical protein
LSQVSVKLTRVGMAKVLTPSKLVPWQGLANQAPMLQFAPLHDWL